jgi:hypothetical protein
MDVLPDRKNASTADHRPLAKKARKRLTGVCFSEQRITISSDQGVRRGKPLSAKKSILADFLAGFARIVGSVELKSGS